MAKFETHDEIIEALCDYRKGWTNIESASKELQELAGFDPNIAKVFLKEMKRNNVTQIRGYSKEPKQTLKAKIGQPNEAKK